MTMGNSIATSFMPENDVQEFWQLSGRVDALHDYLYGYAEDRSKESYVSEPLDDFGKNICRLMGFYDVLTIEKKEEKNDAV